MEGRKEGREEGCKKRKGGRKKKKGSEGGRK